jgi:hypothetical protein
VEGEKIPVTYKGKVVGHKVRYSDGLLIFLLEAYKPEMYGR